jgi:hypothetical protein
MANEDKRRLRQLKRAIKQAGNKKRRGKLKRELRDNPEEAHWSEESVGRSSSQFLNAIDKDATRRRKDASDEAI